MAPEARSPLVSAFRDSHRADFEWGRGPPVAGERSRAGGVGGYTVSVTRKLPSALQALAELDVPWLDYDVEYRPRRMFEGEVESQAWWRAWTGNDEEGAPPLRLFATDCSGGEYALWERGTDLPVVYLGSEGELAVLAGDSLRFVALLGGGADPRAVGSAQNRRAQGRPPRENREHVVIPAVLAIWHRLGGVGEPPTPDRVEAEAEPLRRELADWVERVTR